MTDSMKRAIDETNRRRKIQTEHNKAHGIEPLGIVKEVRDLTERVRVAAEPRAEYKAGGLGEMPKSEGQKLIAELEKQMKEAAQKWEFEKAALLRDQILEIRAMLDAQDPRPEWQKAMEDEGHHELEELRQVKSEKSKAKSRERSP
jgi:excinuclease ABC subunit B